LSGGQHRRPRRHAYSRSLSPCHWRRGVGRRKRGGISLGPSDRPRTFPISHPCLPDLPCLQHSAHLQRGALFTEAQKMGSEHQAPGEDTYETGSGQSIFPLPSADTPRRINDSMLDPVGPFLPRARVDNRGGAVATLTSAYVTSSYVTRKSSDPWWEIRDVYVPDAQEEAALIRVELECVETDTGLAFDRRRFSPRQHWQSILLPRSCEEVAMSNRSQHSTSSSSLQPMESESLSQQRGKEAESGSGPE